MRYKRHAAVLVAAIGLVAGSAAIPSAEAAPTPAPVAAAEPAAREVTLITGDKVRYLARPGAAPRVLVSPGPGRQHRHFMQYVSKRHAYVLPDDAAPLVANGTVDRRLFDITQLAATTGDTVPLIVRYAPTAVRPLAAARTYRHQPLSAMRVRAADTAGFWKRSTARSSGVERIWLDGTAKLSLDRSVPHVGAPAAWQRGLRGGGVKVAVLDTGYDPTHPDLAGAVVASQNFTPDPAGVVDTIGHGTHVAATVAGRTPPYTGVAPEASLLIGKVCSDHSGDGGCRESDILAGMEWAAEQGAKIVNLSLGGGPTDGTDPLSTAVDALTARYGTLFVASAGNHFPWESGDYLVAAPATANSALAVASTTLDNTLSDFSNKGPRVGDHALKPDIAAPGDGIVAARATDGYLGDPVGDRHVRMSGTSMAAPHVAGAAALLAQQHPGWRAAELKAALLSTATAIDQPVYAVGAGLLDAARATGQPAWASPGSLSLGYFKWPNAGTAPATRQLTYHNDGSAPLTLSLELAAPGVPAGFFSLSATSVTVPARGTATVSVTATVQPGQSGRYGGHVVARGAGDTVVRTAIGAYQEPESYTLDLRTVNRHGIAPTGPNGANGYVVDIDTGAVTFPTFSNGRSTLRLSKGRYAVWLAINTDPTPTQMPSLTFAVHPVVDLRGDAALTFDARNAKLVTAAVDRPGAEQIGAQTVGTYQPIAGEPTSITASIPVSGALYALPTAGTTPGFSFFNALTMLEPEIRMAAGVASPPGLFRVPVEYAEPTYSPRLVGDHVLAAVYGGAGTPADLSKVDARGKLVLLRLTEAELETFAERMANVKAAGGRAIYLAGWNGPRVDGPMPLPVLQGIGAEVERLYAGARAGTALVWLHGIAGSPYQYNLVFETQGGIPSELTYRVRDSQLARVDTTYGAQAVGKAIGTLYVSPMLQVSMWTAPNRMVIGSTRQEYFTTGRRPGSTEPLRWGQGLRHEGAEDSAVPWGGPQDADRGPFTRAGRSTESWNIGPIQPCMDPANPPLQFIARGLLIVDTPLFCDSTPGHTGGAIGFGDLGGDVGSVAVLRDGVEIARSEEPGSGFFELEAAPGRYEVRSVAERAQPWTRLTPRSTVTWSTNWSDVDAAPPMLDVRMATALDIDNKAPAGRARLDVQVAHTTGGTASAVSVEVSYDDGATWQPVTLRRDGSAWTGTLQHPSGGGYVSLRASARDAAGNSVNEEVLRAYALR